MRFDQHSAALLNAAGYIPTYYPASWEDVGDCENGPELAGGPAYVEWRDETDHIIIVCEGEVADVYQDGPVPEGWEQQF